MFESGVVSSSALNVTAHGSQQNGAILGNGCALFLCRFMGKLVYNYRLDAMKCANHTENEYVDACY